MKLRYPEQEKLISKVILQIQTDMYEGDYDALYELLERIEPQLLMGFISEAEYHEKLRWN